MKKCTIMAPTAYWAPTVQITSRIKILRIGKDRMKKSLIVIPFLLALVLSGCGGRQTKEGTAISTPQMVEDVFASIPKDTTGSDSFESAAVLFTHSFQSDRMVYEGGEMIVPFHCSGEIGAEIGYLLILDGHPQPYKLSEDGEYRYMHTLTIRKAVTTVNFIFDPVTGNNGEQLELCVINVADPEHRISLDGSSPGKHLSASIPVIAQIDYQAETARTVTTTGLPYITKISSEYTDLSSADISSWTEEDLRRRSDYSITVNGTDKLSTFWGIAPSEPACIHLELWGNPAAEFSVLFYMDGEPLLPTDNSPILLQNEQGKKLILDVEIDIPDQPETVIYAVILYRNAYDMYYDEMQWFSDGQTYYFIQQKG